MDTNTSMPMSAVKKILSKIAVYLLKVMYKRSGSDRDICVNVSQTQPVRNWLETDSNYILFYAWIYKIKNFTQNRLLYKRIPTLVWLELFI